MKTIYEFVEESNDNGYLVSLMNSKGTVIMRTVTPSRYPHIIVDENGNIIKGEFIGGKLNTYKSL